VNQPGSTDHQVDAAIARVLAAESAASAAVEAARVQAQAQLERARADVRRIAERTGARLQRLTRRIAAQAEAEVARLQWVPSITDSAASIDPQRVQRAAMAVATELSGGSP